MFSKVLRRTHMYIALFLSPWVVMYAFSTFAMNHHEFFHAYAGGDRAQWQTETRQTFHSAPGGDRDPKVTAGQILKHLGMEGGHTVNAAGERITILRTGLISPRRITYTPADGSVVVEKQEYQTAQLLSRLHMRRGYQSDFAVDDAWAVSVDVAVAGIFLWILTGVWMWWELRVTRRLGAICALAGLGLFTLLLFTV